MRPDIQAQLNVMPRKERKQFDRVPCKNIIEYVTKFVPEDPPIIGLCSAALFQSGQVEIGLICYTAERFIFASEGPGLKSSTPRAAVFPWTQISQAAPHRPFLGPVTFTIVANGQEYPFHVSEEGRDCKDYAMIVCENISEFATRAQFQ